MQLKYLFSRDSLYIVHNSYAIELEMSTFYLLAVVYVIKLDRLLPALPRSLLLLVRGTPGNEAKLYPNSNMGYPIQP